MKRENNKRICIRNQKVKLKQYFSTYFQYSILSDKFITEANILATMLFVVMLNSINCGGMLKLAAEMLICFAE